MDSNIEYLKSLKQEAIDRRTNQIDHLSSVYLNKICQEIKTLKETDPQILYAKVDLGLYDRNINYKLIQAHINQGHPINIQLNMRGQKVCNGNDPGFLGLFPKPKCEWVERLVAEMDW